MIDKDGAQVAGPQIRIRALREAHGLSVSQLIERIAAEGVDGVHPDTVRNVELGYKRASKPLLTAWAKALGLSPLDVWQPEPLKSSRERVAS
ncbi:helix-turn-helix domain-containing protein [Mycobacteroides abscessus]|uniref:helix-turn-helix domain-containing protein n=1 Tax=Mycobacteroides abscessus TaxID=36809 RepID=UPI000940A569|nr:helix-turn-helix transcriptional regulator [Mycobacteroides abscessus]MDO3245221.1 helix-turn-helix transcriptional regulator [Mycobacteroides abscessus subsp. abscessus]MDO3347254.1 helix-turn-helix transcriptional regulator [Mycobacteroides abscessus subsp. abscessus]